MDHMTLWFEDRMVTVEDFSPLYISSKGNFRGKWPRHCGRCDATLDYRTAATRGRKDKGNTFIIIFVHVRYVPDTITNLRGKMTVIVPKLSE